MILSFLSRDKTVVPTEVQEDSDKPGEGLADERWMATVWRLTSISRAEFDATYRHFFILSSKMLSQARSIDVESAGHAAEESVRVLVVTVLKIRKARIMPRKADLEESARMAETMSFALVVACVLDLVFDGWRQADLTVKKESVCPIVDDLEVGQLMPRKTPLSGGAALLFLPAILSPIAMRWVWKEPLVVNELVHFFTGTESGELRQVIGVAARKAALSGPLGSKSPERPGVLAGGRKECPRELESATSEIESLEGALEVSHRNDGTGEAGKTATDATGRSASERGRQQESPRGNQGAPSPSKAHQAAGASGKDFVGWLRAGLDRGELTVNQHDSWLHVLSDGSVFLKMPYLLHRFAEQTGQRPKQIHNKISRKGTIRKRLNGRDLFYGRHPNDGVVAGLVFAQRQAFFSGKGPTTSPFISEVLKDKKPDK